MNLHLIVFGLLAVVQADARTKSKAKKSSGEPEEENSISTINARLDPYRRRADDILDYTYGDGPRGPTNWPSLFEDCGGTRQSPINLETSQLVPLAASPLVWSPGHSSPPKSMSVTNNNRTFVVVPTYTESKIPTISGGPASSTFKLSSFHFHWGTTNSIGSEHTINTSAYPMEMHIVYVISDSSTAVEDNVLVVTHFFQVSKTGTSSLDKILKAGIIAARKINTPIKLSKSFPIASLAKPFVSKYMTYLGSFTTPPCTESVRFMISNTPINISKKQLAKFRQIARISPGLINNFRPVQQLNNRIIYSKNN